MLTNVFFMTLLSVLEYGEKNKVVSEVCSLVRL